MGAHRTFDHRIKLAIIRSRNPRLFPNLDIAPSTARGWIRNGISEVVTIEEFDWDQSKLVERIANLEMKLAAETARNALVGFTFRLFGLQVQYHRLPSAEAKSALLARIKDAVRFLPLMDILATLGLSTARYYSWLKREVRCLLPDQTSCPKLTPSKLTGEEKATIRSLVTSKDHVHFSIPSLAWFARREGQVFASIASWYRVIAELGLKRPLKRIYPPKPKVGIRAAGPNFIWHLDQTLLRLENGTRIYIQAIIDNFSRFILAWEASTDYGGRRTRALLEKAATMASQFYPNMVPTLLVDSGVENLNAEVDLVVHAGLFNRLVAQIDLEFSNSMIESFFRLIKHRWLYLISLPNFDAAYRAIARYMADYCQVIPKDALAGGTPFEVWSGSWTASERTQLLAAQTTARANRIQLNRAVACSVCNP